MMNASSWLRSLKLLQRSRTTSLVQSCYTWRKQRNNAVDKSKAPQKLEFYGTHDRGSNDSTNGKLYMKSAAALLGFGAFVYLVQKDKIGWPFVVSRRIAYNVIADVADETALAVVWIRCQDVYSDYFGCQRQTQNGGSGFIVSSDGLIVTNAHVVEYANHSIEVQLQNEQKFSGYILAMDRASDVALIRINATSLPVLKLGNSADTRVGETVLAIGSPHGLFNSVTSGIVSSFRSAVQLDKPSNLSYIQTDAPMVVGNSGGPLVNLDGEAIGVNSMTMEPGISFAIPINHVKQFMAKVESDKRAGVQRKQKYVGFTLQEISFQGVVVVEVVRESPAYRAGVHPGDIIKKVNGKDVYQVTEINESVERYDELGFTVNREGTLIQCLVQPEPVII